VTGHAGDRDASGNVVKRLAEIDALDRHVGAAFPRAETRVETFHLSRDKKCISPSIQIYFVKGKKKKNGIERNGFGVWRQYNFHAMCAMDFHSSFTSTDERESEYCVFQTTDV
jgi:hypothetical protein